MANPNESENSTNTTTTKQVENKKLPSINDIWNSSIDKQAVKQEKPKAKIENNNYISQVPIQQPKIIPNKINIATQKPVNIIKPTAQKQTQTQTQTIPQTNVKTIPKVSSKTVQQQVVQPQKVQTVTPIKTQNTTKTTNAQDLKNYKISLRNKLANKIDFLSVVGDGKCCVVFKISSNGNLVNRAFQKQSDNDSLNDAVYKAILSLPSFNPPPSSYNGELLHFNVSIVGGNFEVSLI